MNRIIAEQSGGTGSLSQRAQTPLQHELTSSFDFNSPTTPLEALFDGLTSHFVEQTADATTLISMVAGGFAYRLGRIGIMGMGSSAVLRPLSVIGGLGSEVTTFEFVNRSFRATSRSPLQDQSPVTNQRSPNLWSWSGSGGWCEGLLSSSITFGTLRGLGFLAQDQNILFQHFLQSTGLVAERQILGDLRLAPRPEGALPAQFLSAEATLLQMGAGMALTRMIAPGIHSFERGLEISMILNPGGAGTPSMGPHRSARRSGLLQTLFEPPYSFATAIDSSSLGKSPSEEASPPDLSLTHVFSERYDSNDTGSPPLPSPEKAEDLTRDFLPQFPSPGPHIYSDEIIKKAISTPSEIPQFHEQLLTAFNLDPERGSLSQRHSAEALKQTFRFNSLQSTTGTLENALLQLLTVQIMAEKNAGRRNQALHALFRAMGEGLSRTRLEQLFAQWGSLKEWGSSHMPLYSPSFLHRHEASLRENLGGLDLREKVQILNFLHQEFSEDPERTERALEFFGTAISERRYEAADIEAALLYARRVPFGRVVLRRMLSLFVVDDIPAKLIELTGEPPAVRDIMNLVREAIHQGSELETVAQALNGTWHTGYMKDSRLARKVVAVMRAMASYFKRPIEERQNDRGFFHQTMQGFLLSGAELDPERLVDLINANPTLQTRSIQENWRRQTLQIRFLPDQEMNEFLENWGRMSMDVTHLFYKGEGERPDQILIRPLPPPTAHQPVDSFSRIAKLSHLCRGLVHEFEHWRHFTGHFEGEESRGRPFPILSLGRETRLVTEVMALLEDNQWLTRNVTDTDWEVARRLGLNLTLYYRAIADLGYFGKINERLAKEW